MEKKLLSCSYFVALNVPLKTLHFEGAEITNVYVHIVSNLAHSHLQTLSLAHLRLLSYMAKQSFFRLDHNSMI